MLNKIVAALTLSLLVGCRMVEQDVDKYRPKKEVPQKVLEEMVHDQKVTHSIRSLEKEESDFFEYTVSLHNGEDEVYRFTTIETKEGKKGWVVLFPILVNDGTPVARYIAESVFCEEGISSVIMLKEPLLDEKIHRPLEKNDSGVLSMNYYFKDVVTKTRMVVDYLKKQEKGDDIALYGISLGAIEVASVAPFVDVDCYVLFMGGGNLEEIVFASEERLVQDYKAYLVNEYGEEKVRELLQQLPMDPIKMAQYNDPNKFVMIITTCDESVPTKNQLELREALGFPRSYEIPLGHYSVVIAAPYIEGVSGDNVLRMFDKD